MSIIIDGNEQAVKNSVFAEFSFFIPHFPIHESLHGRIMEFEIV